MTRDRLLAIDVGTGSIRAAIVNANGEIEAIASRPHEQITPRPDWSEQQPAAWWQGVVACLNELPDKQAIAAVAVCGQMHGPVPVDSHGRVLLDTVQLWNDKRPVEQVSRISTNPDGRELEARAANPASVAWTGFKIAWMKENQPEAYQSAAVCLVPKDFINFMLTNEIGTDFSEASGSFMMDVESGTYRSATAAALGIDLAKLPPIHASSQIIGTISSKAAGLTGLDQGIPVVAGGGDFPVSMLGSGAFGHGIGSDTTGTSTLIAVHGSSPMADPALMNLRAAGDGWITFTMIDAGGDSMRWARRLLNQPDTDFDWITEQAAMVPPGAEGLLFLPYLNGERLGAGAHARGQFFGVSARHTKDHFHRAVMEGAAHASRRNIELMRRSGAVIEQMVLGGGGAKGDLWPWIKAQIYNMPIIVPANAETAILGCAALAGIGVGLFDNAAHAVQKLVKTARVIQPEAAAVDHYARGAALFDQLYQTALPLYEQLRELENGPVR